jgi:rare lipoprotein A
MGRWLVILCLAVTDCVDTAVAAPPSSDIPLPKPRPARMRSLKITSPDAARSAAPQVEDARAEDAPLRGSLVEEAPLAMPRIQIPEGAPTEVPVPKDQVPEAKAPVKSGRAAFDCTSGKRVVSAYYSQGERTASGQPFNPQGLTAAHRTLPFGTRLTVSNPRTGKAVTVVVNDRGPFVSGVGLDLSLGAAQAIGMRSTGTVCVW